jgi:hypothetical protein
MPIPIVVAALVAGGSLVPHAAGGFIVVSSAGGYIAGTYLSTAAIVALVGAGTATLATGAALATGLASSAIGSAGIFGTTVGASGLTGVLMSAGLISATPLYVPLLIGAGGVGATGLLAYGSYQFYKLKRKLSAAVPGQEVVFTPADARIVQRLLLKFNGSSSESTPAGPKA